MVLRAHSKIVSNLYEELVNNNGNNIINLIGEKGSGKQIIIDSLLELLVEGWNIHVISSSEYSKVNRFSIKTKKRYEFFPINSISIKIGLLSIGGSLRFQEVDSIFCDIEKQFIKEVNKDIYRSLVLIENYDNLDDCEKKFVNTILFSKNIFKKESVYFLVTSRKIISKNVKDIYINPLSIEDINELINQNSINKNLNSQKILILSCGNYELAKNLINHGCEDVELLEEIINKRIIDVQKKVSFLSIDEIYEICIYGSYFLNGFTLEQILLLNNKEYSFDILFKLFVNLNKIGIVNSNQTIINYDIIEFKNILKSRNYDFSILYLQKFYQFYTHNYDDLYLERLEYLLELYNRNVDEKILKKITGLIFINAILNVYNRTILTNDILDTFLNKIISKINNLYYFPNKLYIILSKLIKNELTYNYLKDINFDSEDILIKAEMKRLSLNLFYKDSISSELMNNLINESIEIIENNSELNYETYAALRLQDTIIAQLQRSTLYSKLNVEIKKYINFIDSFKMKNNDIYLFYKNLKYRRATLYEKCDIAMKQIQDAIAFNNEKNNIYELYYCYVNLLGLYVITDNQGTNKCKQLCEEINNLIENNKDCHFDKKYKLSNNLLLASLQSDLKNAKSEAEYIDIIKIYCEKFNILYTESNSNVVRLNYISLITQIAPNDGLNLIDCFIKENGNCYNLDSFYIYNLNNLKMIIYIMKKEWDKAKHLLEYLKIIDVPHYNSNDIYYKKRIEAFEIIIDNKITCNSLQEYDNVIKSTLADININCDYFNGLDDSWDFFSKSFILSDLQHYD